MPKRSLWLGTAFLMAWGTLAGALADDNGKPLQGAIILVDPGHGGQRYSKSYTGGTRGRWSGATESELNLRVGLELARILEEKGAKVYVTRKADHRLSSEGMHKPGGGIRSELQARVDFIEHYVPHFWLSVHHNAGGGSGHTTLFKMNAPDGSLYKELAQDVNDALAEAVPGPKNKMIDRKGKLPYYIENHTETPGIISEAGFMTNRTFDELSSRPDFPAKEAGAIAKGAIKFWTARKSELIALRDKLADLEKRYPHDPDTYIAIELNPAYQEKMKKLLAQVEPSGNYDPAKIGPYVESFKKLVITDPAAFTVKGEYDGDDKLMLLTGKCGKRDNDQLIDMLIAMRLFNISNKINSGQSSRGQQVE